MYPPFGTPSYTTPGPNPHGGSSLPPQSVSFNGLGLVPIPLPPETVSTGKPFQGSIGGGVSSEAYLNGIFRGQSRVMGNSTGEVSTEG